MNIKKMRKQLRKMEMEIKTHVILRNRYYLEMDEEWQKSEIGSIYRIVTEDLEHIELAVREARGATEFLHSPIYDDIPSSKKE